MAHACTQTAQHVTCTSTNTRADMVSHPPAHIPILGMIPVHRHDLLSKIPDLLIFLRLVTKPITSINA